VRPPLCLACNTDSMFGPLHLYPETGMGKGEVLVATMRSRRVFGKVRSVPLTAWTCRQCGHLELIAADPEALFEYWSAEQR
jgi:hypothetical protein